jgi:transcription initiation factor IIE alpha subunit
MEQKQTGFHIGGNALRLATLVRDGGKFYDKNLREALGGMHRNSLREALAKLKELGAIDYTDAKLGRTREPRTIVILDSPVWAIVAALTTEVGQ